MTIQTRPGGFAGSRASQTAYDYGQQAKRPQVRMPSTSSSTPNTGGGLQSVWDQLAGGVAGNSLGGGSNGGASGGAGGNNPIKPAPIYSNQQKQEATNAAVAQQQMGANMPWLTAQQARPGMSIHSPAAASRALPSYAGALAGGAQAGYMTPLEMDTADASHLLAGQSALAGSEIDYNRISNMLSAGDRGSGIGRSSALLQLLTSLMG